MKISNQNADWLFVAAFAAFYGIALVINAFLFVFTDAPLATHHYIPFFILLMVLSMSSAEEKQEEKTDKDTPER